MKTETHLNVADLTVTKPFSDLFPVNPDVLNRVAKSMREDGYDDAHPIQIATGSWTDNKAIVVDGHTRIKAAKRIRLTRVPIINKAFANREMAIHYAIDQSRDRHNRTDAEILGATTVLDELKKRGGDRRSEEAKAAQDQSSRTATLKSHQTTAKTLGVSEKKVREARSVAKEPELAKAVRAGKKTLHAASKEAETRRAAKAKKPRKRPNTPPPVHPTGRIKEDDHCFCQAADGEDRKCCACGVLWSRRNRCPKGGKKKHIR